MKTGLVTRVMRFFLTDLGHHRVILGYPWFVVNQPKIDWACGWIDTIQLPLILRDAKADKPQFNPSTRDLPDPVESEILYIRRITVMSQIARQTTSSTLAEEHDRPNLSPASRVEDYERVVWLRVTIPAVTPTFFSPSRPTASP